jgi:hypothetical protein
VQIFRHLDERKLNERHDCLYGIVWNTIVNYKSAGELFPDCRDWRFQLGLHARPGFEEAPQKTALCHALERFRENCSHFKGRALLPQRRRRSSAALPGIGFTRPQFYLNRYSANVAQNSREYSSKLLVLEKHRQWMVASPP